MRGALPMGARRQVAIYVARNWPLYAMISPALIVLALFHYYPMYGVIIAFQDFNPGLGFAQSPWVGLQNFEFMLALPDFGQIFLNTLVISVGKIISVQVVSIVFALMLNEVRSVFFKRAVQTFVYLPHFLSWIVLGGILFDILSAQGLANQTLGVLDIKPILFLGSNDWFQPTLIISNLWKEAGWAAIIYLAGLTGLDPALYEAAAIDGAGRWQRILHVTIPGILSLILLIACLDLGHVLNAGFEQVLTLYNPAVYSTGDILDTWVYRQGLISAQYSLAAAVGLVKSGLSFVLIIVSYWLALKVSDYRIF
jgi:putative aldouronate transport system permease protein